MGLLSVALHAGSQVDPIPSDLTWDWEAGELQAKGKYSQVITSYDYASPISEAGDYGQPGINGPNKFEVRSRQLLQTSSSVSHAAYAWK